MEAALRLPQARGHHLTSVWRTGGEPWHPPSSVLLPARLPFSSRPAPVPRPGASRCRCALICYACAVATGPAAHDRSASFPCIGRPCTGKTKEKQAGQHTASRSWEELQGADAVTALKVMARKRRARRACLPWESKQAVHLTLLPLLWAELGQTRQESSRFPEWGQAREPAALRNADQLEDRQASCCPCGFCV